MTCQIELNERDRGQHIKPQDLRIENIERLLLHGFSLSSDIVFHVVPLGHWYRSIPPELACHFPQAVDIQEGDASKDSSLSTITMSKVGLGSVTILPTPSLCQTTLVSLVSILQVSWQVILAGIDYRNAVVLFSSSQTLFDDMLFSDVSRCLTSHSLLRRWLV